jgi:succinate dehydrogenase/fumarate reductase cytochrome b subunit
LIAQQYLTITWNYASGTVLQPGASQTVTMTIDVNQYITGVNLALFLAFNFFVLAQALFYLFWNEK